MGRIERIGVAAAVTGLAALTAAFVITAATPEGPETPELIVAASAQPQG